MAKILSVSKYYTGEYCPNCSRNRLLTYKTNEGLKTVCEKCNWCVENDDYFDEDDEYLHVDERAIDYKKVKLTKDDIIPIRDKFQSHVPDRCFDIKNLEDITSDISEQIKQTIYQYELKYKENMEMLCICELALLYLNESNISKKDDYCKQGKLKELSEIWDYWIGHSTEEFAEWLTDREENYLIG